MKEFAPNPWGADLKRRQRFERRQRAAELKAAIDVAVSEGRAFVIVDHFRAAGIEHSMWIRSMFGELFGMTPGAYLTAKRVERARALHAAGLATWAISKRTGLRFERVKKLVGRAA